MYEASVIVTAGDCVESLQDAIAAVLRKPWARRMEIVAVTEQGVNTDAIWTGERDVSGHTIKVIANRFAPGPKGARRTGLLEATTSVIAFCDDSEAWDRRAGQVAYGAQYVDRADAKQAEPVLL